MEDYEDDGRSKLIVSSDKSLQSTKAAKRGGKCVVSIVVVIISLCQGPKPAVLAGRKTKVHISSMYRLVPA